MNTIPTDAGNDAEPPPALTSRERRRLLGRSLARACTAVVLVLTLYYILPVEPHSHLGAVVRVLAGVSVMVAAAIWEVRAVLHARYPTIRAIDALAVTVVVAVAVFAILYLNLSARNSGAFNEELGRTSSLYFTIITLATIGYGDIAPLTDEARIAVMFQTVVNIAFIGSVARLIVATARRRGPLGRS